MNTQNDTPNTGSTLPTTEQLAMLAATLARHSTADAHGLAAAALKVWHAAQDTLAQAEGLKRDSELKAPLLEELFGNLPRPKRYPVTRDEFVWLMLPQFKGRTADSAAALKAYCKELLEWQFAESGSTREATREERDAAYANWKPIANARNFAAAAVQFRNWWSRHHSAQVSEVRRKAAAKAKRRARPPLARLQAALKNSGT